MINGSEGDRNRGPEARLFFDDRIVVVHERANPRQPFGCSLISLYRRGGTGLGLTRNLL